MSNPVENTQPEPEMAEADSVLVQRMAKGDKAAFSQLYDRFSRPLYATAVRILNDASEAEDVVQEIFLNLWNKAASFESSRGTAFSWAITLTRNRAIDRIRSKKRRYELLTENSAEVLPAGEDTSYGTSADDLWLKEKATAVRSAVAMLPSDQRTAVELAFFSGLTQLEIAAKLNEPLGTVKARIRRGMIKLRETISRRL